jgi:hypothetical protein
MSKEFEVFTRFRKIGPFEALLSAWWKAIPAPSLLQRSGNDHGWIFAPGKSIRGCSVRVTPRRLGSAFGVRLSEGASRMDWRIAYAFLRLSIERGATVRSEEGRTLQLAELTDAAAETAGMEAFRGSTATLRSIVNRDEGAGPITLPNFRFSLRITSEELPRDGGSEDDIERFEATLTARTARYRDARMAETIRLRNGATLVGWRGEALIADVVDYVAIPPSPGTAESKDHRYLAWDETIARLGDRVELVDGQAPAHYLRAIDESVAEDRALWQRLRTAARPAEELRTR